MHYLSSIAWSAGLLSWPLKIWVLKLAICPRPAERSLDATLPIVYVLNYEFCNKNPARKTTT